ncbi:MAG: TonB-dependent receptor plug domain-containing protein [Gemmatimonadales bacterium]|nr:TonB-dependent receptor plug domain-containing protein [Gemmatimonadales bacterium]
MIASARQSTRPPMALALLAVTLAGVLPACARPTATTPTTRTRTSQVEPAVILPPDTITAPALTSKEVLKRPRETIATLLQGRTSGVDVAVGRNGALSVRIRGPASFYANGEPLYVIDGVPVSAGPGGALAGINPYEIESITVLKNPAETALYGVRGGNGVIVIKTKRPSR